MEDAVRIEGSTTSVWRDVVAPSGEVATGDTPGDRSRAGQDVIELLLAKSIEVGDRALGNRERALTTVLEAMASGTPVIASNAASVPEVAGDAAILVDPADTDGMASAILRLHDDTRLRASMIQKGTARAQDFSWATAANEHAELYREVTRQVGSTT